MIMMSCNSAITEPCRVCISTRSDLLCDTCTHMFENTFCSYHVYKSVDFVNTIENGGMGLAVVTLNGLERQKYEKLFDTAVIQFSSLSIYKSIGEGELYNNLLVYV